MAVCAFVILFQSVLATMALLYFKSEFKRNISAQQMTLLSVASQDIDQKLKSAQKALIALSREFTPQNISDPKAAQWILDHNPDTASIFDNALFLFSKEGRIIVESPYIAKRRGRDISFRDYYKQTIKSGKPIISPPFFSTHTPGTPSVMFTVPIRDKAGHLIAILGAGLNLLQNNFLGDMSRIRIAKTGYLYLISHDRTMIMHPDKTRIMKIAAKPGENKLLDKAINGFEGTGENTDSKGQHALTSFKHLQATDWILGANYPLNEAYEPIQRGEKYFALAVVFCTAVIIFVVRFIMNQYTHTLVRFADHVRHITHKQGSDRLFQHDSKDEIGILVQTFNAMVEHEDRKSEELLHTSTHDSLTGLYNRSYFDAEMERLSRGRQTPISVVIADIDLLKECNDTIGHAAGDVLIRETAATLLESFRAEDVVARIGGDEFGVLLPGVDAELVKQTLDRLRKALLKSTPPVENFPLSVSLGCATAHTAEDLIDAFEQADQRMYHEKRRKKVLAYGN